MAGKRRPPGRRARRALLGAAAVGVALVGHAAAQTPANSFPDINQNGVDQPAFTYDVEPFHCQQPKVDVYVDSLNVMITVTSYAETVGDSTLAPYGRAQFAMATFDEDVAYQSAAVWEANSDTATTKAAAYETAPSGLKAYNTDPYFYRGACDLGADPVTYPTIGTITQAVGSQGASMRTEALLTAGTVQTLGCDCAAYAVYADGGLTVIDNLGMNVDGTPNLDATTQAYNCLPSTDDRVKENALGQTNRRVFYTKAGSVYQGSLFDQTQSATTNYWSTRQTTCGATDGDDCVGSKFAVITENEDSDVTRTCSLRTESVFIMPINQFTDSLTKAGLVTQSGTGSKLSYQWGVYVKEYASTKEHDPNGATADVNDFGIDMFQTRVTPTRFQLDIYPAGAVVERLSAGDVAPPMLVHTSAFGSAGPVSFNQREDANTLKMSWQMSAYVQQSNRDSAADTKDTVLYSTVMATPGDASGTKPSYTPTIIFGSTAPFTSTCETWGTAAPDGTTLAVGQTALSCATDDCAPIAQADMPADLLSGLLASQQGATLFWVEYYFTVTCTITHTVSEDEPAYTMAQDFKLPPLTVQMKYALQDVATSRQLTDMQQPPFVVFQQPFYRSPGVPSPSAVAFPLVSRLITLNEDVISEAASLSDIIYNSETNVAINDDDSTDSENRVAFSQAVALKVQLLDTRTRNFWQVAPQLMLMVAHDFNGAEPDDWRGSQRDAYVGSATQSINPGSKLPLTWCASARSFQQLTRVPALRRNRP